MSGVWDTEKETEKEREGAVFSVRCLPGLNESTCFSGGEGVCDKDWGGWGERRARRDTDLQQGLFQGSLHSTACLHFNRCQSNQVERLQCVAPSYLKHHKRPFNPAAVLPFGARVNSSIVVEASVE